MTKADGKTERQVLEAGENTDNNTAGKNAAHSGENIVKIC